MARLKNSTINGDLSVTGTLTISALSGTVAPIISISATNVMTIGNSAYTNISLANNMLPDTDNSKSLGSSTLKYSDIETYKINGQDVLEYEVVDEW